MDLRKSLSFFFCSNPFLLGNGCLAGDFSFNCLPFLSLAEQVCDLDLKAFAHELLRVSILGDDIV